MSVHSSTARRPGDLRASIRTVELRIRHRRDAIGAAVSSMADDVRDRLVSPGTLIAAGLFGATIHQSHRLRGLRLLAIPQAVTASLRLLLSARSRTRATPDQG